MRLSDLVGTSGQVARASGRLEKVALLAALLRRLEPDEIEIAGAFLCGNLRQAKLGVGFAGVQAAAPDSAAASPTLTLSEVDAAFARVAGVAGKGSVGEKLRLLRELLAPATRCGSTPGGSPRSQGRCPSSWRSFVRSPPAS